VRELRIRPEAPADAAAVRDVLAGAFPTAAEAALVERLRGAAQPRVALVADDAGGQLVGHILFTPVEVRSASPVAGVLGLAPLAVRPERQRRGVGSALVRAGLCACRETGARAVVVLGHPGYYPRFGFSPAWSFGLYYRNPGRNPAFMALELEPGALRGRRGEVCYHPAFSEL
jgi:putative acetyltransferase